MGIHEYIKKNGHAHIFTYRPKEYRLRNLNNCDIKNDMLAFFTKKMIKNA